MLTTLQDAGHLPRWDLTPLFPSMDSPQRLTASAAFVSGIDALTTLVDRYGIGVPGLDPPNQTPVAAFEDATGAFNDLLTLAWRLEAYCYAQVAVDAGNAVGQARWSEHQQQAGRLHVLQTRYNSWLATLDLDTLIDRQSRLTMRGCCGSWPHRHATRCRRKKSRWRLS